jgi:hypothetical protein
VDNACGLLNQLGQLPNRTRLLVGILELGKKRALSFEELQLVVILRLFSSFFADG